MSFFSSFDIAPKEALGQIIPPGIWPGPSRARVWGDRASWRSSCWQRVCGAAALAAILAAILAAAFPANLSVEIRV